MAIGLAHQLMIMRSLANNTSFNMPINARPVSYWICIPVSNILIVEVGLQMVIVSSEESIISMIKIIVNLDDVTIAY
jgi:hypothetical protein